ncbi:MAG TPA: hypothetical protein PLJ21_12720 [Pseudobdellovibrionaceae bacterium]|nr:hypothetical protein [Pseudobdellovibrionaceae bacterium]
MKQSFIPIEFRPKVRGIELEKPIPDEKIDSIKRRRMLKELVDGQRQLEGVDAEWLKKFVLGLFPSLKNEGM